MSEANALEDLWDFCTAQGVFIHPDLQACASKEAGAGVYATAKIIKGQKIVSVPANALFTTAVIPESFISARARKQIPVHALLAAFLTFGNADPDVLDPAWTRTWPDILDFTTNMPLFWPDHCRTSGPSPGQLPKPHTERVLAPTSQTLSFSVLPPPITGSWLVLTNDNDHKSRGGSTCIVSHQQQKLKSHLEAVAKLLPLHSASLLDPRDPKHWRFVYNWCCVNSRCFYYVAPGQKTPNDSNEAMAMCPGMDMFNHTDDHGCITKYDRNGYNVITDKDYETGEEVFFSYGAHSNDVLWADYGFLLDDNCQDAIKIDKLVVEDLNTNQRDLLAEFGYLGEFWLERDGVSWNVEVAARLFVLSKREWLSLVREGVDPLEDQEHSPRLKRESNRVDSAIVRQTRLLKVKRKIVEWLMKAKVESEASLRGLGNMTRTNLQALADNNLTLKAQGVPKDNVMNVRMKQAQQRRAMCLKRWAQIWQMCMRTLRSIEQECEDSVVTKEPGNTMVDLHATLEQILSPVEPRP